MDNLKIGILVLGPCVLTTLFGGCSPKVVDVVPARATVSPALVSGSHALLSTRNDARLGTPRDPIVRDYGLSVTATYDRQQIINGRPYVDFDTITRSRAQFERSSAH